MTALLPRLRRASRALSRKVKGSANRKKAAAKFQRQLTYKAQQRGVQVIEVGRFFASSKTCSACGEKNEGLTLGMRRWRCAACGREHERDINAAVNILQEGIRLKDKAPGAGVSACGARSSGRKPLANDETPRDEAGSSVSHNLAGRPGYA